ncbi:MAG: hypothetical protein HYW10_06155 [Candidatus Omnitrophica bacterium]|nr:hypothetical protein [Candidatus Omnitrophota bacterium]
MMNQRGLVMALSLAVVVVLTTLGASFLNRSLSEDRLGRRTVDRQVAFYLAEAGVDRAIAELRNNPAWSGVSYTPMTGVAGGYEVTVAALSPALKRLTSTGHVPSNIPTAAGYQPWRLETVVEVVTPSVFQSSVFGAERVRMKVNDEDDDGDNDENERPDAHVLIDSYDSSVGTYLSQTPGQQGDVGTNHIEDDAIRLKANTGEGSITVHGQVKVGPNLPDPATAVEITGTVTITGNPPIVSQAQALSLPAVTIPSPCSGGGDMKLKGGEALTLFQSASPYCYTKLDLKDQSSIIVQGNVVIYTGEFTVKQDAQVNAAGRPTQLIIQVTSNKNVKLQDGARVVAGIYAPQSKAKVKDDVVLYGSLVAARIKVKHGAALHYDEALASVGPSSGSAEARLRSWREP